MSNTYEPNGIVQGGAYSLDRFRELINNYLDHMEEEHGDEVVMLFGGFVGKTRLYGPTDTYPNSHRIDGQLGYPAGILDEEAYDGEFDSPIGHLFEASEMNAMIGAAAFPRKYLDPELREAIGGDTGAKVPINPEIEEGSSE